MKPYVATTEQRGIFFGYLPDDADTTQKTLRFLDARMIIKWHPEKVHGVMGLVVTGPGSDCRVGPRVDAIVISNITAVATPTPAAVQRWEAEPWSK